MDDRLRPLVEILELNTTLLHNCCQGVSDGDAGRRLADRGNNIGFLASHLIDARHFLAAQIGHGLSNPLSEALADARSIEEIVELPSLTELLDAWDRISRHLRREVRGLTPGALDEESSASFPISGRSRLSMIAFLLQHESYHIGQMGFLRRQLGYPAMAYDPL